MEESRVQQAQSRLLFQVPEWQARSDEGRIENIPRISRVLAYAIQCKLAVTHKSAHIRTCQLFFGQVEPLPPRQPRYQPIRTEDNRTFQSATGQQYEAEDQGLESGERPSNLPLTLSDYDWLQDWTHGEDFPSPEVVAAEMGRTLAVVHLSGYDGFGIRFALAGNGTSARQNWGFWAYGFEEGRPLPRDDNRRLDAIVEAFLHSRRYFPRPIFNSGLFAAFWLAYDAELPVHGRLRSISESFLLRLQTEFAGEFASDLELRDRNVVRHATAVRIEADDEGSETSDDDSESEGRLETQYQEESESGAPEPESAFEDGVSDSSDAAYSWTPWAGVPEAPNGDTFSRDSSIGWLPSVYSASGSSSMVNGESSEASDDSFENIGSDEEEEEVERSVSRRVQIDDYFGNDNNRDQGSSIQAEREEAVEGSRLTSRGVLRRLRFLALLAHIQRELRFHVAR